jgi:hypothetical protein
MPKHKYISNKKKRDREFESLYIKPLTAIKNLIDIEKREILVEGTIKIRITTKKELPK